MGCNCKVGDKIKDIDKLYGEGPIKKEGNWLTFIYKFLTFFIVLLFIPFIAIHIFYRGIVQNKNYFNVNDIIKGFGYVGK